MTIDRNDLPKAETVTVAAVEAGVPSLAERSRNALTEAKVYHAGQAVDGLLEPSDRLHQGMELVFIHAASLPAGSPLAPACRVLA